MVLFHCRDSNGRITYREFKRMCEVSTREQIPDKPIDTDETLANDAAKAEANANKKKKKDKKNKDKDRDSLNQGTPIEKKQTVVITNN